ncbi:hypothetical protein FOCC_FOCC013982 [Frankliniella occidentalis]|nr:hypothetical protein FOCC_FOCC013982 [Frankliniella occidentalis]
MGLVHNLGDDGQFHTQKLKKPKLTRNTPLAPVPVASNSKGLPKERHPNFINGTRVFNLDEKRVSTVGVLKEKIISPKGVKQVHQATKLRDKSEALK